jgi:hypothetical protein
MHVTLAIDIHNLKCYMWWLFVTLMLLNKFKS